MSMTTLANSTYTDKPTASPIIPAWFGKAICRPTCDTVIAMTRRCDKDLLRTLRATGAEVVPRSDNEHCFKYQLTRPKLDHLEPFWRYLNDTPNSMIWMNRLDIAYNFYFPWDDHADAHDSRVWKANRVNMKWKGCAKRWYHGLPGSPKFDPLKGDETLYWEDTTLRDGEPARRLALYERYHERPLWIVDRLELGFQCTAAVKANGLDDWSPSALREINPRAIAEKHFKFTELSEEWLQGQRQWSKYRRLPVAEMDEHIARYRAEVTVMKGVVHPLPKEAYTSVSPVIKEAFFNLIPTRLEW